MNTPEERLRDALTASAALVELDDERVVAAHPAPHRRTHRLIPILVAVTVVAVTVLGVALRREDTAAPDATNPRAPAPYFLANVAGAGHGSELTVRDVRTGAIKATVPPPAGVSWEAMSATTDPHTFWLVAQGHPAVTLYRLTIDDGGRIHTLARMAAVGTARADLPTLAASPDGSRIAFPVLSTGGPPSFFGPGQIDVLDLATHRLTAYRAAVHGRATHLSWAADGRHLAFEFGGSFSGSDGIWILDTHAGHDLLAASHQVQAWPPRGGRTDMTPVLSADGSRVYAMPTLAVPVGKDIRIVELDARTGRQLRVVFTLRYQADPAKVVSMFTLIARDPTGRSLLVVGATGVAHVVDLTSGRAAAIPFPGGVPSAVAW